MKRNYSKTLRRRKSRIDARLAPKNYTDQPRPIMQARNIQYQMAGRTEAMHYGGIGAFHLMAQRLGLVRDLDENLHLLKVHLPYHESDHVLNQTYNVLTGGQRLEDIELRRQDESYLNALGAQRLPDPTTAGDFCRRFGKEDVLALQECFNRARQKVWKTQPKGFLKEAFLDVDGTVAGTGAECKEGIGLSYKGIWGYAPLILSLANTKEVLYVVNRPANAPSHSQSAEWIDRAFELVGRHAGRVTLRGDTDFSHTAHLDRWDNQGHGFVLGMDANKALVKRAQALEAHAWQALERLPKYDILTEPRAKPARHKERLVEQKGYKNIKLVGEDLAEIEYSPVKCKQSYRLIMVRKNLTVKAGERALFDDHRYFFYITNRRDLTAREVVGLANDRCNQENVIEQLKNGVNAMRMPVDNLVSNWAFMAMAAQAWNLKAWFGLLAPRRKQGLEWMRMEFRGFLQRIVLIPCQVVRTARRTIFRLLGYHSWLDDFFQTWERLRTMRI